MQAQRAGEGLSGTFLGLLGHAEPEMWTPRYFCQPRANSAIYRESDASFARYFSMDDLLSARQLTTWPRCSASLQGEPGRAIRELWGLLQEAFNIEASRVGKHKGRSALDDRNQPHLSQRRAQIQDLNPCVRAALPREVRVMLPL